jgi:HSP20 family molecular chaperone IbpA
LVGVIGVVVATPVDIYKTASEVVVKVIIFGKKQEDVDITITSDNLSIKGQTKVEKK